MPPTVERTVPVEAVTTFGFKEYFVVSDLEPPPPGYRPDCAIARNEDAKWMYLCEMKYDTMRKALQQGIPVLFRNNGNSLDPLVHDGDTCYMWPVYSQTTVLPGDIVLAHVQPGNRYYCHLVWSKEKFVDAETQSEQTYFVIGNNREGDEKRMNGWCYLTHIYGMLVKTQRV